MENDPRGRWSNFSSKEIYAIYAGLETLRKSNPEAFKIHQQPAEKILEEFIHIYDNGQAKEKI